MASLTDVTGLGIALMGQMKRIVPQALHVSYYEYIASALLHANHGYHGPRSWLWYNMVSS